MNEMFDNSFDQPQHIFVEKKYKSHQFFFFYIAHQLPLTFVLKDGRATHVQKVRNQEKM